MFRQLLCSDWRHSMSTSLLYHAFGIRGYTYTQTAFVGGTIHLWIRHVHSIPSGYPEGPAACQKGLSWGWTLHGTGGSGAAQRDGLHDCRLVTVRPPGRHSGRAKRTLVD